MARSHSRRGSVFEDRFDIGPGSYAKSNTWSHHDSHHDSHHGSHHGSHQSHRRAESAYSPRDPYSAYASSSGRRARAESPGVPSQSRRGRSETRRFRDDDYAPSHQPRFSRGERHQEHKYPPRTRDTQPFRYHGHDDDDDDNSYSRRSRRSSTAHNSPRQREDSSPDRHPRQQQGHRAKRSHSAPSKPSSDNSKFKSAAQFLILGNAARIALQTGAQTAYKVRNDPSPWVGPKGAKVATAALGAALVDGFLGKRHPQMKGGMRHIAIRLAAEQALGKVIMEPAAKKGAERRKR